MGVPPIPFAYRSRYGNSIADLMLQRGDIASRGAARSGALWGQAVNQLGQIGADVVRERGEERQAQEVAAQEEEARAQRTAVFGEILNDPRSFEDARYAFSRLSELYEPPQALTLARAFQTFGQAQGEVDPEKAMGFVPDLAAGYVAADESARPLLIDPLKQWLTSANLVPEGGWENVNPEQFLNVAQSYAAPAEEATGGETPGSFAEYSTATPERQQEILGQREVYTGAGRAPERPPKPEGWEANPYLRDVDWSLQGRELLESLHPSIRGAVERTAFHQIPYSAAGRGKEMRQAILALAPTVNPEWSQHSYTVAREFARGQPAKARRAINNALADANLAFKQSKAFERTEFPWVNQGTAWFYEKTGRPEEMLLRGTLKNLATEFALAQKNGLAPLEREIEEMYDRFASTTSPAQLNAIIRNDIEFTLNRLVTLENDWERYFGEKPTSSLLNRQTIGKAKEQGFFDLVQASGLYLGEGVGAAEAGGGGAAQTIGRFKVEVE